MNWDTANLKLVLTLRSRMLCYRVACKVKMRTFTVIGYYNGGLQMTGEVKSYYHISF